MRKLSTELTQREAKVFTYVHDYIQDYGYSPTIRQIGQAAGLASTSSVSYVLAHLQDKGYITRTAGRQALAIDPGHAGKIQVNRDDLAAALKLIEWEDAEVSGPVARLARAAGCEL